MEYTCILLIYILGIAVTGSSNVATDLVSSNQINDYSFVKQPFTLDSFNATLRCASGLGPPDDSNNAVLGGWYFNGVQIPFLQGCMGPIFEARSAGVKSYTGVINLYRCRNITTNTEGIYSCIMMNSSMMNQTMRVGVYFRGRSESLYMHPITSLLTIFYLSTQLLQ